MKNTIKIIMTSILFTPIMLFLSIIIFVCMITDTEIDLDMIEESIK